MEDIKESAMLLDLRDGNSIIKNPGEDLFEVQVLSAERDEAGFKTGKKTSVPYTFNRANITFARPFTDTKNVELKTNIYFTHSEKAFTIQAGYDEFFRQLDRHAKVKRTLQMLTENEIKQVYEFAKGIIEKRSLLV